MIFPARPIGPSAHRAFLVTLALSPFPAWAEAASPGPQGVTTGVMLQTVLGLLFILGLLFLAAYLLRKLNGGRGFGGNGPLRVVGGLMISTRERIVLVEVGETWLVIGVGPGQLRTLHTMPKGEIALPAAGEKPFAQWLKQITERKNENK